MREVGLGRAPAVEQADAGALGERLVELRRHAGGERDPRGVRGFLRRHRPRQQDRHHGAEQIGDGRLAVDEAGIEARRRESLFVTHGAAGQQRLIEGVERVGVEQRQAGAEHVAGLDLQQRGGVDRPPEVLRLRAADALRRPGGAGRVEDQREIVGLHRRRRDRLAAGRHRLARRWRRDGPTPSPISQIVSTASLSGSSMSRFSA